MAPRIRPGKDEDAEQLIALIGACWALYPGIRMDVDGEMPELRALATYYARAGGALWVAEDGAAIVGMAATRPLVIASHAPTPVTARREATRQSPAWEACRVYVHPSHHGAGLGHRLLDTAEAHAIAAGAARIVLWSDTRFGRAHRFYEKRSYVRAGPIRVLRDISNSLEFAYAKPVNGVEMLDAAASASAGQRLSDILIACVTGGAGVSFLPPLASHTARAFWQRTTSEIAAGRQVLLCGWADGVLAGTVTLHIGTPPNQPHRAEVRKLLVHPDARRHGLARALMQRAELEATRAGRSLLTLDTRVGDAAERLYRTMGWQEAGRIPDYALNADGTPGDTVFFWKTLRTVSDEKPG
ncbi:MAG TPA: GNAT family N-acetyltransferase [Acetobacteraceae bacterium]|nr:GNAT family N-acetyltransferase [Acetobacteraceae bacterium]